jgi:Pectate lyase superfamily protein
MDVGLHDDGFEGALNDTTRRRLMAGAALAAAGGALVRPSSASAQVGHKEFVNVTDYGATGDGTTDDTAAINTALAAVPASGGGLYFPSGNYKAHLNFSNRHRLTIFGDGSASIIHNEVAGVDALRLAGCNDVTIRDLRVQGLGGTRDGVRIENCRQCKLERVFCKGTGNRCFYAELSPNIMFDHCSARVDDTSPWQNLAIAIPQTGLVIRSSDGTFNGGCNAFVVVGGHYIVGQSQGWAIDVQDADMGTILGPVAELSGGGIRINRCKHISIHGSYGEANPYDVHYDVGTVTVSAATPKTVTGSGGTQWNTETQGAVNGKMGAPGKWIVVKTATNVYYSRIAAVNSDTQLTVETNLPAVTGASYDIIGADLLMDFCWNCRVSWMRAGGGLLMRNAYRNIIDGAFDAWYADNVTSYNRGLIQTNSGNSSGIRHYDKGTMNEVRILNDLTGILNRGMPLPTYALVDRPTASGWDGVVIYVKDAAAGSKFQGSNGTSWVSLG